MSRSEMRVRLRIERKIAMSNHHDLHAAMDAYRTMPASGVLASITDPNRAIVDRKAAVLYVLALPIARDEQLRALLEALKDPEPGVARFAIFQLGRMGDTRAVAPLRR